MTRTLEMWKTYSNRTGDKNIADYLFVGDIITTDLIIHIRNHMTLESDRPNYIQLSEIQDYYFDFSRSLKPAYHTFSECDNKWRYHGVCYKWETINRE